MSKKRDLTIVLIMGVITFIISYLFTFRNLSDFNIHMETAKTFHTVVNCSHAGWHFVTWLCYVMLPLSNINVAAALSSALFEMLMTYIVLVVIRKYLPGMKYDRLICFLVLMVGPIYLRFYNPEYYLGQGTPNIWHNPTTNAVRPIGLLILLLTFDYWKKLWNAKKSELTTKELVIEQIELGVLLGISVIIKPSFAMVYMPACAIVLLIKLVRDRFKSLPQLVMQHLFLLVPALIILLQYIKIYLFGGTNSSTDSGVAISLFASMKIYAPNVFLSQIFRISFPILIIILWNKKFFKDKACAFCSLLYLVGFAEAALLTETGARATHGNFGWGSQLAATFLWIASVCFWLREMQVDMKNETIKKGSVKMKYIVTSLLLLWHAIAGIVYYVVLIIDKTKYC